MSLPTFDEPQRLAAVRRLELLDMPTEPEFDELTGFAASICEVPISIISLIDERREWYISSRGVQNRELPLELTFCQYTVAQDDLLVVEDTRLDERFVEHPAVTCEQGVRFYAGISIYSPDGQPVGTLCVADRTPRQLTSHQLRTLRTLAHQTNARLAMREQRLVLESALASTRVANARLEASEREVRQYQHELEAANRKLLAMATTDSLTGLLNRRAFHERLSTEFALARRNGAPLSLLMLDVDNFKLCNDTHGHDAGDRTLTQFAGVLQNSVRETDLVVRYGGEEFVVLLPDTNEASAKLLGQRILAAVRSAGWPLEPVTASAGCATMTEVTSDGLHLVSQADEALYAAKRAGKDRIVLHSDNVLDRLAAMGS